MRFASGSPALRSAICFWIAIAHSTAATTEGNSSSIPSPIVLTMRPAVPATIGARCLAPLAHALRSARFVLAHQPRVADHVGGEDRGEAAGGGHCSGTPALRMPSRMALKLGQICRVVAHRRPGGAGAGDGVGRVERETGLDRGMRLVESTKLREGGGQLKIC